MHPPDSTDMTDVLIRDARVGDGEGSRVVGFVGAKVAQCWLDSGRYYASLNPELFQIPQTEG